MEEHTLALGANVETTQLQTHDFHRQAVVSPGAPHQYFESCPSDNIQALGP